MNDLCPVCNGLQQLSLTCPVCSKPMYDSGSVADFLGPYSPYMDEDTLDPIALLSSLTEDLSSFDAAENQYCIHLLVCPNCGCDKRISVCKSKTKPS